MTVVSREVKHPFGTAQLISWGDAVVFQSCDGYVNGSKPANVTINGVGYIVRIDLVHDNDGWHRTSKNGGPYIDRVGWNNLPVTDAARKAVRETLCAWLASYMTLNPDFVQEGGIYSAAQDIESAEADIIKAKANVAAAEAVKLAAQIRWHDWVCRDGEPQ